MYLELIIKNFFLADTSEVMAVTAISAFEPKNVWFLHSRHDVRRVHEEAEMTLTAISSLESARRKFFMNSTYIMSRK